jgi:hypothetical protein
MSKIKLPRFEQKSKHEYGELVRIYLRALSSVYVNERDIAVEFYDSWNFVKVSVYKWCDAGVGCGTSESRDITWAKTKTAMLDVFDVYMTSGSWRWVKNPSSDYGGQYSKHPLEFDGREGYIPGMTYLIKINDLGTC